MNGHIRAFLCVLVAAGLALPGCLETGSQQPKRRSWWDQDGPAPPSSPAPASAREKSTGGGANPLLDIFRRSDTSGGAKDGNYTILLYICRSPTGHVQQAKYFRKRTEEHAGWKNLFAVVRDDHSLLCWGRYKTRSDAQRNLKRAQDYVTPASARPYALALIIPVPGKEDVGPPEWRLEDTPARYVYTVLVAEFYDVPDADYIGRRKFAVDFCKQLRQKRQDAYYKHDPASSIVTIGLFERSAVQVVTKGKTRQRVVRDPRIRQIFAKFPDLAVNGRQKLLRTINAKTKQVKQVPAPTYLMIIPREKPYDATTQPTRPPARAGQPQPRQAPGDSPGAGRPAGPGGRPGRPGPD